MSPGSVIEKAKIWFAVRIGWRMKGKIAEAIRGFQATEADGVWHLHRGLLRTRDPKQRAIMFAHSLEEESHAEEFGRAYGHYSERIFSPANFERKDLYAPGTPIWKTFAFLHVGEEDATERFRFIRDALDGGVLKESLGKVIDDETGHVDLTHKMLLKMGATEREIWVEVRKVQLLRLWEGWLRIGKRVVDNIASVLLSAAYFLVGGLLAPSARRKLSQRFVEYDNNQIKRLVG